MYYTKEEMLKEYGNLDKVDWEYISECQILSEDFIREFKDKVDWKSISVCQILSEDFIIEFKDKVHWGCISEHQNLSENFIREFKDGQPVPKFKIGDLIGDENDFFLRIDEIRIFSNGIIYAGDTGEKHSDDGKLFKYVRSE
jgi:hypothetical protein